MAPFEEAKNAARAYFQRRMLVIDNPTVAIKLGKALGKGLHMGWDPIPELGHLEFISIAESDKVLGKTYDNLFLDLRGSFTANDLGKVISTVRGGGLIIMLTPPFEKWVTATLSYHEKLAIPPYTVEQCRHLFIPRLIRKLYEHEGIWIYRNGRWEKESREELIEKPKPRRLKPPKESRISKVIYGLARSQDQIEVLKILENLQEDEIFVLTADRGRGKSAVLGLGIAGLRSFWQKKLKVIVTSSSFERTSVVFEFLQRGLKALGIPGNFKEEGLFIGKKIKVMFLPPKEAAERSSDLLVVDEAASIPLPLLKRLAENTPVVFSTTIHGYEGSGRTFSIRFKSYVEARPHVFYHMEEPIRYAAGDPIEKWLFDTLLLDAEPEPVKELAKPIKVLFPEPEELFRNERLLRNFFGLLVIAHYKNTPNDLMTIADAPHHHVAIAVDGKNRVVGAVQFAFEGGLSKEQAMEMFLDPKPEGNLIPDVIAKHYGLIDFATLKGARVVRIVTHPALWRRGIGSKALKALEGLEGIHYIGASFGAAPGLVAFWSKNGFLPVSISPARNAVSGEYSVLFVKPLTEEAKGFIFRAAEEFTRKFLHSLAEIHWDMEVDVAWELLKAMKKLNIELELNEIQKFRLKAFLEGRHIYEVDCDVLRKITEWYFATGRSYLTEEAEKVLIAKVLQMNSWKAVREKTSVAEVFDTLRDALEKIAERERLL